MHFRRLLGVALVAGLLASPALAQQPAPYPAPPATVATVPAPAPATPPVDTAAAVPAAVPTAAPPPAQPPAQQMDGATYAVRLRDLQNRIDQLKEQIRRSHTKLSLLS